MEMDNRLEVDRSLEGGGGRKEVCVPIKGNRKDLCGDGNVLYLECININIQVVTVLQNVTIGGN